ncbi:hypothetical protein Tfer_2019 [Thermincola ferriacetica]|uniref:Metal-binding protein n=1 Tax=Thermincola ferriacetica TaxID=281456 RepID=A0A0L6W1M3_9FIRM|nr:DUF2284 domain-containing protein [Thermincola ferriacetica]KNZ69381.1 hypothetical protein Tfer_2019 [Thermincola ferriacetica]
MEITVGERVRLKCMVPPCPNYGRNKFCPPNLPDLEFIRKALAAYRGWVLVVLTVPYNEKTLNEIRVLKQQNKLMKIISSFEKTACANVNHLAFGLTVGGCKLSDDCPPPGERCRRPLEAQSRYNGLWHRYNHPGQKTWGKCGMAREK